MVETEPKTLAALPINPVGIVKRNPGVKRMKRRVGTKMLASIMLCK